jgi:hypothetical protein
MIPFLAIHAKKGEKGAQSKSRFPEAAKPFPRSRKAVSQKPQSRFPEAAKPFTKPLDEQSFTIRSRKAVSQNRGNPTPRLLNPVAQPLATYG